MKFEDIVLGSYLVSPNKSFLYFVYEKDYYKKTCMIEVLDVLRPLLKFADNGFRFQEHKDFKIFELYVKPIKKEEKMNREQIEAKILEILTETSIINLDEKLDMMSEESAIKLSQLIMNLIPKSSIEQVEEFMKTTKQPTENVIGGIGDRVQFRIELIEEELYELKNAIQGDNLIETIDALGDLQYVLDGFIIEYGLKDLKDEIITEIHRSNMSKFDKTVDEGKATYEKYQKEEIETFAEQVGENLVTYRSSDNKVLKSCNYSPPNLKQFII